MRFVSLLFFFLPLPFVIFSLFLSLWGISGVSSNFSFRAVKFLSRFRKGRRFYGVLCLWFVCDGSRSQDFNPTTQLGDVMPQCVCFNPFLDKPAFVQASNTLSVFTFVLWGWLALTLVKCKCWHEVGSHQGSARLFGELFQLTVLLCKERI